MGKVAFSESITTLRGAAWGDTCRAAAEIHGLKKHLLSVDIAPRCHSPLFAFVLAFFSQLQRAKRSGCRVIA